MNIKELESLREGWDFEGKKAAGKGGQGAVPESFWETYSAMANSQGGRVVLGVKERGDHSFAVHGVADPDLVERELWNLLQNRQKVSVNLLQKSDVAREEIAGRTILVITVPRARREERPVYINGDIWRGTFIRVHEGDRRTERDRIRRMIADAEYDSRDDRVLTKFGLNDLDEDSLLAYRQIFRAIDPDHPWVGLDDQEFLGQIGAWRRDRETGNEGLTLAGLLFFGTYTSIREVLPGFFVDYQQRKSDAEVIEWSDRVYPDGKWSGNLFDFYRRTVQRLVADLRVPFELEPDLYRRDNTHVHEALREALVNTLIHADYEGRVSVLAVKQPEAFEFRNPGQLRLPIGQIRQGGLSDCRNRTLQRMFLRIGLGEQAGSGFSRILRAWREQHWIAPSLVEDVELDTVTLHLSMASLLGEEVLAGLERRFPGRFRQLDEVARLAVATALAEGHVTNLRMQEISDRHPRDLTFMLRDLVIEGFLAPHGDGRGTWYTIRAEKDEKPSPQSTTQSTPQWIPQSMPQFVLEGKNSLGSVERVASSRWRGAEEVRAAIQTLCRDDYRTVAELAAWLKRAPRTIQENYIKSMVAEGLLEPRYPEHPRHPQQAYRTVH